MISVIKAIADVRNEKVESMEYVEFENEGESQ